MAFEVNFFIDIYQFSQIILDITDIFERITLWGNGQAILSLRGFIKARAFSVWDEAFTQSVTVTVWFIHDLFIVVALRKVTPDMQTHKNPQLRTGPAPFKAAPAARGPPAKQLPQPGAGTLDKPPVFARDGKKWLIVRIVPALSQN